MAWYWYPRLVCVDMSTALMKELIKSLLPVYDEDTVERIKSVQDVLCPET